MGESFLVNLDNLQPSQLYICAEKLAAVKAAGPIVRAEDVKPVPVRELDGRLVLTDGHTRAFAALEVGLTEILAGPETDELDWQAYRVCVDWCLQEGVRSVTDLRPRVVCAADYERLWHARCRAMHADLEARRRG